MAAGSGEIYQRSVGLDAGSDPSTFRIHDDAAPNGPAPPGTGHCPGWSRRFRFCRTFSFTILGIPTKIGGCALIPVRNGPDLPAGPRRSGARSPVSPWTEWWKWRNWKAFDGMPPRPGAGTRRGYGPRGRTVDTACIPRRCHRRSCARRTAKAAVRGAWESTPGFFRGLPGAGGAHRE